MQQSQRYSQCFQPKSGCKLRLLVVFFFILILQSINVNAQQPAYDELLLEVNVEKVGSIKMPAIIYKEEAYLSVKDLFDFLKIKTTTSEGFSAVTGFFIHTRNTFLIDKKHISFQNKHIAILPEDAFITETSFYLKSSIITQVFSLKCMFNFSTLSVNIATDFELPAIREAKAEVMRKNISQLKGELKADTTISKNRFTSSFGIADWSITSMQQSLQKPQTRIDLALGGMIVGGEVKALFNYNSNQPLSKNNQVYSWKYVNNKSKIVKQFVGGTIFTQSTTTLNAPIKGVQFTNAPTTYRKAFGTYRLNSKTEPGWLVELYVNNALVNYTTADASGFFTFDVPLVYGTLLVRLKFYGPWGEEQVREENISIPYNFLPAKQFEYFHTSGLVQSGTKSIFSKTAINYGLNNHVTIGGGMEYLSSLQVDKTMPFLTGSVRILSNILLTGNYTHGVKASGSLNYRLPSNLQFDLDYTRFDPNQQVVLASFHEERKLSVSMPLRGNHYSTYSRLSVNQVKYFKGTRTFGELLFSGSMASLSANITTYAAMQAKSTEVFSNISIGYRFPKNFKIQPQFRYEYHQKKVISMRVDVEKNYSNKGSFIFTYDNNFLTKNPSVNVGFRYDLSFLQTQASVQTSKFGTTTMQSARGSLWVENNLKNVDFSNRSRVGRGGILLVSFLDINGNNKWDIGEQKLKGLKFKNNGGITVENSDSSISITDLEAYSKFRLEFNRSSFENISWQLIQQTMDVEIQPNSTTKINLAVQVLGEVAGTVYLKNNHINEGIGRIIIAIHNAEGVQVANILSEPDGYFSFLGLKPGTYTASIEKEQLQKLSMKSKVESVAFTINKIKEGDVVDGLEFILESTSK